MKLLIKLLIMFYLFSYKMQYFSINVRNWIHLSSFIRVLVCLSGVLDCSELISQIGLDWFVYVQCLNWNILLRTVMRLLSHSASCKQSYALFIIKQVRQYRLSVDCCMFMLIVLVWLLLYILHLIGNPEPPESVLRIPLVDWYKFLLSNWYKFTYLVLTYHKTPINQSATC